MGDMGSVFLGFTLAALPLIADVRLHNSSLFVTAILFVLPFVTDSAYTILRRIQRRENVFKAHRSHLYQQLVARGWSHGRVSALYGMFSVVSVACGVAFYTGAPAALLLALVIALLQIVLVELLIRRPPQRRLEFSSMRSPANPILATSDDIRSTQDNPVLRA
jgi:4-hydroxybenzoate polyprenyltransferase